MARVSMDKFENLIELTRNAITAKHAQIVSYDVGHQIVMSPIQLTTKELKAVLLKHGEYAKIMASGNVWTCFIKMKSLGCGVHSVWLEVMVTKVSSREPMPPVNHN
jgi:hypothetical protein